MSDNMPGVKSAEELGKLVREVWIQWAREQPVIKEHWVTPWERLSEADKDVDRRIGLTLWRQGITEAAGKLKTRLDAYVKEHGIYDNETGQTEYPGTGEEYVQDLSEQIEEIETARDNIK